MGHLRKGTSEREEGATAPARHLYTMAVAARRLAQGDPEGAMDLCRDVDGIGLAVCDAAAAEELSRGIALAGGHEKAARTLEAVAEVASHMETFAGQAIMAAHGAAGGLNDVLAVAKESHGHAESVLRMAKGLAEAAREHAEAVASIELATEVLSDAADALEAAECEGGWEVARAILRRHVEEEDDRLPPEARIRLIDLLSDYVEACRLGQCDPAVTRMASGVMRLVEAMLRWRIAGD